MHRDNLLKLLAEYANQYPAEAKTTTAIQDFVNLNADCFQRELADGHITGSAWIVDEKRSKTLLTHHKKLDIWVQLGGHADGDANIASVAMKEAQEESGLQQLNFVSGRIYDIDIHLIPARGDEKAHYHYDCRFLIEALDENYVVSDESHDLRWVPINEIKMLTSEVSVLRMASKLLIK